MHIKNSTSNENKPILASKRMSNIITIKMKTLILSLITILKLVIVAIRLSLFALLLSPAFFKIVKYWLYDKNIHRNIKYGNCARNVLDIYLPSSSSLKKRPVVVFISGDAWIIGYITGEH